MSPEKQFISFLEHILRVYAGRRIFSALAKGRICRAKQVLWITAHGRRQSLWLPAYWLHPNPIACPELETCFA